MFLTVSFILELFISRVEIGRYKCINENLGKLHMYVDVGLEDSRSKQNRVK